MSQFNLDAPESGCVGDGVADDTDAVQRIFDLHRASGERGEVRGMRRYRVRRSVIGGSGLRLTGGGTFATDSAIFVGAAVSNDCALFRNFNSLRTGAPAQTDSVIEIEGFNFDYGGMTGIAGGGLHAIALSYVQRFRIASTYCKDGENAVALRGCKDGKVENNDALNQHNAYYDCWEGSGNIKITKNTGRCTHGDINQGIQVTGTGTALEDLTSLECSIEDNTIIGVRKSNGQASALIVNANDAGSKTLRVKSAGNLIKNCDLGIVCEGAGGQHTFDSDTLEGVTGLPIFFQLKNGAAPANVRVLFPTLINCGHATANIAMIALAGVGNEIIGLKVINDASPLYQRVAWFTCAAIGCNLEINDAPNGTLGAAYRIWDQGVGNRWRDGVELPAQTTIGGMEIEVSDTGYLRAFPPSLQLEGYSFLLDEAGEKIALE